MSKRNNVVYLLSELPSELGEQEDKECKGYLGSHSSVRLSCKHRFHQHKLQKEKRGNMASKTNAMKLRGNKRGVTIVAQLEGKDLDGCTAICNTRVVEHLAIYVAGQLKLPMLNWELEDADRIAKSDYFLSGVSRNAPRSKSVLAQAATPEATPAN